MDRRIRSVTTSEDEAAVNASRHMRSYLSACLFQDLHGLKRPPPWQLSPGKEHASPYHRSDKCAHHAYHYAYARYLAPLAERFTRAGSRRHIKILEIGLGCGQSNVGAGVRMWNTLFANDEGRRLELHVLEFDARCARIWQARWAPNFQHINLRIFTGDQSNVTTLMQVSAEGGGRLVPYDAIIDDGGHSMEQQQTSLAYLFELVAPGGWYAIEDLQTSFDPKLGGRASHRRDRLHPSQGDGTTTVELLAAIASWMSGDLGAVVGRSNGGAALPMRNVLQLVEHVDCFTEICVLSRYAA